MSIFKTYYFWGSLQNEYLSQQLIYGYNYFGSPQYSENKSLNDLKTTKWLLCKENRLVAPQEITINELADEYDKNQQLGQLLGFKPLVILTEAQQALQNMNSYEKQGYTPDKIQQLINEDKAKKEKQTLSGEEENNQEEENNNEKLPTDKTIDRIRKKIKRDKEKTQPVSDDSDKSEPEDMDDYTRPSIDFGKKRKDLEEKTAREIEEIEQIETLTQITEDTSKKYTFEWFKTLLKLETKANGGENKNAKNKGISISFSKIEKDDDSGKYLILKNPNRYIPQHIEDLSDFILKFNNGESVQVSSCQLKEYSLKVKLENPIDTNSLNFQNIKEASIRVKSADFLLGALLECFETLKFNDDDNLKEKLPKNLEFVFGPPGTGKTTYLADKVSIPSMNEKEDKKVLILTPTNKAADVLTSRIVERMNGDKGYKNWLVRFGATPDENLDKLQIVKDRTFNLESLSKKVVVTTIPRFTYDTTANSYGSKKLYDLKWDYIIIDEASMVHLPAIIFAIYKRQTEKFIIAGDPFQIGPIAQTLQWKDENIYTMVGLNKTDSFKDPQTKPHNYNVIKLQEQYRSIESIGNIFSKFTYNGILKHNRENSVQRKINIGWIDDKPLNIIKFPVSKYESIYRPKWLNKSSSYHIYSAIFTFEFVKKVASKIKYGSKESPYKIGIISPYKIQADIVYKLFSQHKQPENIDIQVGTIHGFQGDECDIIVALFNTPQKISPQSFVNKQNVLNVAISRAKDYLFILMPDENTESINDLSKINKIEKLVKDNSGNFKCYNCGEIEQIMFGEENHIENIIFSTTHQNVNVYSEQEKQYEIRCDDNAVDVQIGKLKNGDNMNH